MEAKDRIIVALDYSMLEHALGLARSLAGSAGMFKVGHELLDAEGAPKVLAAMHEAGAPVFADVKKADIAKTVAKSVGVLCRHGADMLNVYCLSGRPAMEAAVEARDDCAQEVGTRTLVIGVTIPTDWSHANLVEVGLAEDRSSIDNEALRGKREKDDMEAAVLRLAKLAKDCGLDGIICSPLEAPRVRDACGERFLVITPGIRPAWAVSDGQTRFTTPTQAVENGADMLVIGSPITRPPAGVGSGQEAVRLITTELSAVL